MATKRQPVQALTDQIRNLIREGFLIIRDDKPPGDWLARYEAMSEKVTAAIQPEGVAALINEERDKWTAETGLCPYCGGPAHGEEGEEEW